MRPAYLFVMATGVLLVFGYANAGQAINKAGALAHSDGRAPGLRRRLSNGVRSHEGLHRGLASVKGTREQSERDQHLLVVAAAVWPRRWPT
jgi:hypothetical protein